MKFFLENIVFLFRLTGFILVLTIVLIIPQINMQDYVLPTITSKTVLFLYGVLTLCGVYVLRLICSKNVSFSISKIDIALFVLVLYIILNRYLIQSNYGFSIRYIELLGLCFLYVVLRTIGFKNYSWLLLSIVISGIMQAVYGNLQLLGYYPSNHSGFKMTGSFFNPGPYAGFLVSVLAVASGMYLFKDKITTQIQSQIKRKIPLLKESIKYIFEYIPLLGIISITIILPALQSRASWIAAVVSSMVLLEIRYSVLKNVFKKAPVLKRTILSIFFLGILGTGLFVVYFFKKDSSEGRAFIWKVTTEMIIDYPFFGLGFDRFNAYYMNYQAHYFEKNGETPEALVADNTYYAFNEGLQFISENGLLGLMVLLILLHVLFQTKVKEGHQLHSLVAKTALLSIGVFACFSYPMQILPIKLVLVVLLALLSNKTVASFQFKITESSKKLWLYKISLVLLICVSMSQTCNYTKDLSRGFITWNNALTSHQYGDYHGAVQEYEKVYSVLKKHGDFLMNYGKTLSMAGEPHKAIAILKQAQYYQNNTIITTTLGDCYKAAKQYDKAEASYQQAVNMIPSKFYANYLLAKLYDDSGQEYKAVAMAKKLMNKEIKVPSTAIKEIRGEMKKILIKYKNPLGFKN
ncbi:O-antigen ligase family protein [Flavobacterium sp. MAHUQ-51]|uniref:O-antigen ligase family protein n=1 Tax=Flavobacterium sp. GCM10022190 TaxID=3252639 RepID=UPI003609F538